MIIWRQRHVSARRPSRESKGGVTVSAAAAAAAAISSTGGSVRISSSSSSSSTLAMQAARCHGIESHRRRAFTGKIADGMAMY